MVRRNLTSYRCGRSPMSAVPPLSATRRPRACAARWSLSTRTRATSRLRPRRSASYLDWPRPGISVHEAGELLAGVLQLAAPLAGPAESAGGLAAHIGGRGTAGEVDVLAPVHPPRVGAAGVAWEVPGQLPEEPVHDLCPPAVPPERVEPVAEPVGPPAGEIVGVAGEPAVDALGLAIHAQRGVQVIDVELGPFAVAPDLIRR